MLFAYFAAYAIFLFRMLLMLLRFAYACRCHAAGLLRVFRRAAADALMLAADFATLAFDALPPPLLP